MTDYDPNLWASLARQYSGGVAMPVTGQAGYYAQVNTDENNLVYTPPETVLNTVPLIVAADKSTIGYIYRYNAQTTTTDTAAHDLFNEYMPSGIIHIWAFQSGVCAAGRIARCLQNLMYSTGSALSNLIAIDSDSGTNGTISGTFDATIIAAGKLRLRCNSAAGDGSTVWTTSVVVTCHDI